MEKDILQEVQAGEIVRQIKIAATQVNQTPPEV
jgi:hypothetical protein